MDECDTLLIVGSNDPWTEFYPAPGQARAVQIDIDGRHLGNRYPVEVGLRRRRRARRCARCCRCCETARRTRPWRTQVESCVRGVARDRRRRAPTSPAEPVNPERVVRELTGHLPADAQVAVDVG